MTRAKVAFLEAFATHGNITAAALSAGIGSRHTIYRWQENPAFMAEFEAAERQATEALELEAYRRAVHGSPYKRTSYWHGEPVGTDEKIEYSDALLTLLLRARAPEKYRDKVDVNVAQVIKTVGFDPSEVLGGERERVRERVREVFEGEHAPDSFSRDVHALPSGDDDSSRVP
jgi:hypothetical protein